MTRFLLALLFVLVFAVGVFVLNPRALMPETEARPLVVAGTPAGG
ncbi:MAG TPA: hypothetical protein PKA74_15585 [Bauldia sp.]|nr:hypothetical protein [Bauldia sp.]